jgi:phage/plasmid-associated DNA primase
VVIAFNVPPVIESNDDSIWNRLVVTEFPRLGFETEELMEDGCVASERA